MPLNKREKKLMVDVISLLTDKERMADSVAKALLDDADLYLRTWVLPLLEALRDDDKREIDRMARYR